MENNNDLSIESDYYGSVDDARNYFYSLNSKTSTIPRSFSKQHSQSLQQPSQSTPNPPSSHSKPTAASSSIPDILNYMTRAEAIQKRRVVATNWFTELLRKAGIPSPMTADFGSRLKNGMLFCRAINYLFPGRIASVSEKETLFAILDNLNAAAEYVVFLFVATAVGLLFLE
jgi:hypothetical protein